MIITLDLVLFAFTSILTWSFYGKQCLSYFVKKIWRFSDITNALMAIPNLIGLLLLNKIVVGLLKDYFKSGL